MKIAIITLPQHTNYGGILQAYALQTVLKNMGHDVKVVSKERFIRISPKLLFLSIPKRILLFLFCNDVDVFKEFRWNRMIRTISKNIRPFVKKYIIQDQRSVDEINEKDYDAYVVGSDQIWRPQYMKVFCHRQTAAYLDFTEGWNVKRIAYSASFGTDNWEYSKYETEKIRKYIKSFDAVSVRESSAVKLCKDYLSIEAVHLLDPTMLLDEDHYRSLVKNRISRNEKLFVYILDYDEDKAMMEDKVADAFGLIPFRVGSKVDDWSAPTEERIQPAIEDWLKGFIDADFVLTDSFHGCVFSILFHKPFLVIGNKERGLARIESLLSMFDLRNHLLCGSSEFDSSIDYSIPSGVYERLEKYRADAQHFIVSNLN